LFFDNRLIPETFQNIRVRNTITEYPKEIYGGELPFIVIHNPINPELYKTYVTNNIGNMRKKVQNDSLTIEEVLDFITYDFKRYCEFYNNWEKEERKNQTENIDFYFTQLQKIENVINEKRNVNKIKPDISNFLFTRIALKEQIIIGLNEIANKSSDNFLKYPLKTFYELYDELGIVKNMLSFLRDYNWEGLYSNYLNFCFLNFEKSKYISDSDLDICFPLFCDIMNYIKPQKIIIISKRIIQYLNKRRVLVIDKTKDFGNSKKKIITYSGKIIIKGANNFDFVYIPHPKINISKEIRSLIWKYYFSS